MNTRERDLEKIVHALQTAGESYRSRSRASVRVESKEGGHPVTDVEREMNANIFAILVNGNDGWLSEETPDDLARLHGSRLWLVDPLDGTEQYLSGLPEWCISIALIEHGKAVAGGIHNPITNELFCGSVETGIFSLGRPPQEIAEVKMHNQLPVVLASRSEFKRGEWERFRGSPFRLVPMGSVAYKLAKVAVGEADATWSLVPKHEWDVGAGVALLQAARGCALTLEGTSPSFNKPQLRFPGLVGFSASGIGRMHSFLNGLSQDARFRDCWPWARELVRLSV